LAATWIWIRAADAAGWPTTALVRCTAGYGQTNKGWRWTGAAEWSPHDLRRVAACWMLFDLGLDPAVVADKLGHAHPDFTIKRYIGIRPTPTPPPLQSPTIGSGSPPLPTLPPASTMK
jgi:integrase